MGELTTKALKEIYNNPELVEAVFEPCACGAPRAVALGLDTQVCTDAGCPFRVAARLHSIAKQYGLERLASLSDFEYICQERYYRSWVDFFTDDWADSEFEELHKRMVKAVTTDLDVPTLAVLSGFDALCSDQVYNLCGDFQTVLDLASIVESDGFVFISERLGLTASHLIPVAVRIYNQLAACLTDMLAFEEAFMS